MREERKRRSDKRKASTKEANKENPKGGINHCPTYPSSLPFLSFIERFGPMFSHSITFYPFSSPTTVPLPPPPSIYPSILPSIHLSIHLSSQNNSDPLLSVPYSPSKKKKTRSFMHLFVKICTIRAVSVQIYISFD